MSATLSGDMNDLRNCNIENSNAVKVYSSKSILSYQNGSASGAGAGSCDFTESSSVDKMPDKKMHSNSPCCDNENESVDLLRKKLISDLSLQVFSTDLENKIIKMEPMEISKERLSIIQKLLVQISQLTDAEKLLLYLKLQSSAGSRADPLRQPLNPLGNRQEIQQTIVWIKTHLEEDRDISIPKQDVYDQYLKYCENVSMKPLSTADFGKVMKQVYPGVRPRRLGTRGNSRYCYSGMRNTLKLPAPSLPRLVTQGNLSNSSLGNGSESVAQENEKTKKTEKSKRKWKTSTGRNYRMSSAPRLTKPITSLKCPKRSKVENSAKTDSAASFDVSDMSQCQMKTENGRDEEKIKNDDDSINALGNILANDLGLCFESEDGSFVNGDVKKKGNVNFFNKMATEKANGMSDVNVNDCKVEGVPLDSSMRIVAGEKNEMESGLLGDRNEYKSHKVKLRKPNSITKARNFTKTYVPIQPKPVSNPKPKVHFELDRSATVTLRHLTGQKDSDASYVEESDSQEPEEEIVKYFRPLDENQLLGVLGKVNSSVQIKTDSRKFAKFDGGRSQSCFEDQSRMSKPSEPVGKYLLQRSQSSVEFSGEQPGSDCDRDKISHLRLLLEKSIASEKCASQVKASDSNSCLTTRKFLRLDGQKLQNPIAPTRYFNFTPISPGSQSPLKTPTSPFVSPRDTPIPRSRQNSFQNDHFFPPSKSSSGVDEYGPDNGLILGKMIGNHKQDRHLKETVCDNTFPEIQRSLLPIRPRSNSSTNFYRAKAKRSLSKVLSCDRVSFKEPNPSCDLFSTPGFAGNAGFPFPLTNQNVVMSDSLSSEIRQLLENDSKMQEAQAATSRSQSVPLNRMISEGSWLSQQASPIYNHCEASDDRTQPSSGDYAGFEIPNEHMSLDGMNEVFTRDNHDIGYQIFDGNFDSGNSDNNNDTSFSQNNNFVADGCFPGKIELTANPFPGGYANEPDGIKSYMPGFETSIDKEDKSNLKLFNNSLYDGSGDSVKDPVITSFKPVFMGEFSSCPNSPVLGFFAPKGNDENQFIEFLGLDG